MTFILQLRGETYQLINIHQRTKTGRCSCPPGRRISLSISIREPKLSGVDIQKILSISLSISIREPKRGGGEVAVLCRISLSISIREPKHHVRAVLRSHVSAYQYPSENQNRLRRALGGHRYQLINIHQRTKTLQYVGGKRRPYQLINIHQRTKTR